MVVAAAVVAIADLLSVIATAIALIVVVGVRQRRRCAEQRERERPDEYFMQGIPPDGGSRRPTLLVDLT
jgi:hypothetical protein